MTEDKKDQYLRLQNGSDIRGIALEGAEGEVVNLTTEVARKIGYSFGMWLADYYKTETTLITVSIGSDPRLSGKMLKRAFCSGINAAGCTTVDFGLATTPAMFISTRITGYRYQGAVMITASHLPWNRNGFKFFTQSGGLEKEDIKAILERASGVEIKSDEAMCDSDIIDFKYVYAGILTSIVVENTGKERPLDGFRILVDAGNGSGGFFEQLVLKRLGADTQGSLYLEPDGSFPNHIPNPEDPEALIDICKSVIAHKADMGIIFDTDVDRVALIDNRGRPVNRNRFIALCAAIILQEHPGTTIVTDSITSTGLNEFIEKDLGGKHHRFKRGYRNVINEARKLNRDGIESCLAIETSGHAAVRENYWLDDGAYLITLILARAAKMGKEENLFKLIENLREPVEEKEFRVSIKSADYCAIGTHVLKSLENYALTVSGWTTEKDNYEGIRINCNSESGDGWLLVRLSLHDPVLPVNIESDTTGGVKMIAQFLYQFLKSFEELDLSAFDSYFKEDL